jgi:hypothetical protein
MPLEIMPSIGFPFFLLCYMEYFSLLVVDEVVLTAYILDLILLGIGFHQCVVPPTSKK